MSTKPTTQAARAFLRDAFSDGGNEAQVVVGALSGKGFVRRSAGGRRTIDVAMPGKTQSAVPSLRGESALAPEIKLRRYHLNPSDKAGAEKITSATYGVDMDRPSFEALVAKTAAETGKEGRKAVQPSIAAALDQAGRRQQRLDVSQQEGISISTPEGLVKGVSRGRDNVRVDDLGLKEPPHREEPQRELDARLERVKAKAREFAERDAAAKKAKTKSSGKDGWDIGD